MRAAFWLFNAPALRDRVLFVDDLPAVHEHFAPGEHFLDTSRTRSLRRRSARRPRALRTGC